MSETPQPPEKKMPPIEVLSIFLMTCGAMIFLYAGYLWVSANMSISDLREREKELHQSASQERSDDYDYEAAIKSAKEEQDAIREEIKQLHEDLNDMPSDERGFIQEDISELNEKMRALQEEISENKVASRDKSRGRRSTISLSELPPELREKTSLAKTLAVIALFFFVPGLLLRVPAMLKGA